MYYTQLLSNLGYELPPISKFGRGRAGKILMEPAAITHILTGISPVDKMPYYPDFMSGLNSKNYRNLKSIENRNLLYSAIHDRSLIDYDFTFPPKSNYKFTFADLYCNVGGATIAAYSLDGRCVFASDNNDYRQAMYYFMNHGIIPYPHPTWIAKENLEPVDILIASIAIDDVPVNRGPKPKLDQIGDTELWVLIEMIKKLEPKAVIIECKKTQWDESLERSTSAAYRILRDSTGYCMAEPTILNALNFGVPQNRRRLWFAAFRESISAMIFEWPTPQKRTVKLKDILESDIEPKYYLSKGYQTFLEKNKALNIEKGNRFIFNILDNNSTTNSILPGGQGYYMNIICDKENAPEILPNGEPVNDHGWRFLVPRELARLQGFPENIEVVNNHKSSWKFYGRATNINVARNVIESALKAIDQKEIAKAGKMIINSLMNLNIPK